MKLSVIIAVTDPADFPYLERSLSQLSSFRNIEIIVIRNLEERGSDLRFPSNVRKLKLVGKSKAKCFNAGIRKARSPMIVLHHAQSIVDVGGINDLIDNPDLEWGGFRLRFAKTHPLLSLVAWFTNALKPRLARSISLEQCIYARTKLLIKCGGVPNLDPFEGLALSQRLARFGRPVLLPYSATIPTKRYETNGYVAEVFKDIFKFMSFLMTSKNLTRKTTTKPAAADPKSSPDLD